MSGTRLHYDGSKVLLSLGIAFIGKFTAVSLCEQYRLATLSSAHSKRHFVLFLVAISLGWACTWCMHCCSMASIKLVHEGEEIPIRYNRDLVVLAAFQSVIQTYIGLVISTTDPCFNNTKNEIMEKFIARASYTYTLEQIKKMSHFKMLFIVCTHSLGRLLIGGSFGGAGIALMHFIIIMSMTFQGTVRFDPGIVAASVLFAMIIGTGSFWVFFRILSVFPSLDFLRVIVAIMGVVTVCGMHYIGMAAASFHFDPNAPPPSDRDTISQGELYTMAVTSSVIFVIIMLIFTLSDLRTWLLRTSTQLRQADQAIHALMKRSTAAHALRGIASSKSYTERIPVEVVRYTRRYLVQDLVKLPAAGAQSRSHSLSHSMYTDYVEEDEVSVADSAAECTTQTAQLKEISILRRDHLSNHNLADLENQRVEHHQVRHKPQYKVITATSSAGSCPGVVSTNVSACEEKDGW